jgi:hypothetical protein
MMHEDADYAWLLTTGALSRQARTWCDGKPMELWDGQTLVAQARRIRNQRRLGGIRMPGAEGQEAGDHETTGQ